MQLDRSYRPRRRRRGLAKFWPLLVLAVVGIVLYEQQPKWLIPQSLAPTPVPTRSAVSFLADADIAMKAGNYDAAIEAYNRAMRLEPGNPRPLAELSTIYLAYGDLAEALEMAQRAVRAGPKNTDALNALARAQDWVGDYDSALNNALDALELDPENATSLAILGEVYTDEGKWDIAEDYLDQAAAIDGENVMLLRNRAYLNEMRGDYETAIDLLNRAIDIAPHRFDLYIEKGRQYRIGLLDYEKAIEAYQSAVDVNRSAVTLDALGDGLYNSGDHLKAVRTLREATELDSDYGPALVHLGMALYARRNYEDAAVELEKGLRIVGEDARIEQIYTLGLAHIYKEPSECDRADEWLRKALEIDPESGPALEGLRICDSE